MFGLKHCAEASCCKSRLEWHQRKSRLSLLVSKYANSKGCDSLSRMSYGNTVETARITFDANSFSLKGTTTNNRSLSVAWGEHQFGVWDNDNAKFLWRQEF